MKSNKQLLKNLILFSLSSLLLGIILTGIPITIKYIGFYLNINNNLQTAIGILLIISTILLLVYILIRLFYDLIIADIQPQELPSLILFVFMAILGALIWFIYRVLNEFGEAIMNLASQDLFLNFSQNLFAIIINLFTLSIMTLLLFFIAWFSGSLMMRLNKVLHQRFFTDPV